MNNSNPGKYRNFPHHSLEEAVRVADTIRENRAGKPMRRLLLADALGIKPSSSNFRDILSSSIKYGLTTGGEKSEEVALTDLGLQATNGRRDDRRRALRQAARNPKVFEQFYKAYEEAKVPSKEMLIKILASDFQVPDVTAAECARMIIANGRRVGFIQDISNSPHVLLNEDYDHEKDGHHDAADDSDSETAVDQVDVTKEDEQEVDRSNLPSGLTNPPAPPAARPIFLGHGKNRDPLEGVQKILNTFRIPYKVAIGEPNLGRPIPAKVRDVMLDCGSAILIFTEDEKFLTEDGEEVWRPIEFEDGAIEAKTMDLLQELIGFKLVTLTPA